jgi:hypothetical protein
MNVSSAQEILGLAQLALQYGVPAVEKAIADFKSKNAADPTVDEVKALLDGTRPPVDYSGA